jgi:hypothetical protein
MCHPIRNRIKSHRRVRAGDLVPHEYNFRLHSAAQRGAMQAIYREVGFARSLLAYELPDGRLKLIDGHLRRDMDPDMEVEVEILDVNEDEARALLLSIDPLAAMAETDTEVHQQLLKLTPTDSPELDAAWRASLNKCLEGKDDEPPAKPLPEQYLVLVQCRDEKQQIEVLERFTAEGLECKALLG